MTLVKLLRQLHATLLAPAALTPVGRAAAGYLLSRLGKMLDRLPKNWNGERVRDAEHPLNQTRARRGGRALAAYMLSRPDAQSEPEETLLADLLADVGHYAHTKGIAVGGLFADALLHLDDEITTTGERQ